jgi:hypothetical protein
MGANHAGFVIICRCGACVRGGNIAAKLGMPHHKDLGRLLEEAALTITIRGVICLHYCKSSHKKPGCLGAPNMQRRCVSDKASANTLPVAPHQTPIRPGKPLTLAHPC